MPEINAWDEILLPKRLVLRTQEPVSFREFFVDLYKALDFEVRSDKRNFNAQLNRVHLRHVGLDYGAFDGDVSIGFPAMGCIRQTLPVFGSGRVRLGANAHAVNANETCLISPGVEAKAEYSFGYRHLVLRIDPHGLDRKLQALLGKPVGRPIEFAPAGDANHANARALRTLVLNYAGQVDAFDGELSPLMQAEFEQSVLTGFLCANRHNYSFALEQPFKSASAGQVDLVAGYIEANWNRPITIEEIAETTGMAVRSLFDAFKQRRGVSPMKFAKNLRLERAREMLRAADPETPATKVAAQCGFQSYGRFAREYRHRFGESPSQTRDQRIGGARPLESRAGSRSSTA